MQTACTQTQGRNQNLEKVTVNSRFFCTALVGLTIIAMSVSVFGILISCSAALHYSVKKAPLILTQKCVLFMLSNHLLILA